MGISKKFKPRVPNASSTHTRPAARPAARSNADAENLADSRYLDEVLRAQQSLLPLVATHSSHEEVCLGAEEEEEQEQDESVEDILTSSQTKECLAQIHKLTNSTKMSQLTRSIRVQRRKVKFVKRVGNILTKLMCLQILDGEEDALHTVFQFVMQSSEDYLNVTATAEEKADICVTLLSRFTKGDEELCRQIMRIIAPSIKKSTVFRRNKHLISRSLGFFLPVL